MQPASHRDGMPAVSCGGGCRGRPPSWCWCASLITVGMVLHDTRKLHPVLALLMNLHFGSVEVRMRMPPWLLAVGQRLAQTCKFAHCESTERYLCCACCEFDENYPGSLWFWFHFAGTAMTLADVFCLRCGLTWHSECTLLFVLAPAWHIPSFPSNV